MYTEAGKIRSLRGRIDDTDPQKVTVHRDDGTFSFPRRLVLHVRLAPSTDPHRTTGARA